MSKKLGRKSKPDRHPLANDLAKLCRQLHAVRLQILEATDHVERLPAPRLGDAVLLERLVLAAGLLNSVFPLLVVPDSGGPTDEDEILE
ncbi:MAG: hypothetical protein AAGD06_23225 [Acidobacteriota bacterium]